MHMEAVEDDFPRPAFIFLGKTKWELIRLLNAKKDIFLGVAPGQYSRC